MMDRICLDGIWMASGTDEGGRAIEFSARVPGCVHTDLISNGMLEKDMYWRDNAEKVQWIEDRSWIYTKEFSLEELPVKPVLVFEGLDTYCRIILNDALIGECDNMFIPHEFDISKAVHLGVNVLKVAFESPVRRAEIFPKRGAAFSKDRLYTRRMQCTYGWDWVARFVTCGIYLPVYIKTGNDMRVRDALVFTQWADEESAQLALNIGFENYTDGEIVEIKLINPYGEEVYVHREYCCEPELSHRIDVFTPMLWYPCGYGEQPLYTLEIQSGGEIWRRRIGIRTVKIIQKPDVPGDKFYEACKELKRYKSSENDNNENFSGFSVLVNDVPIFCKGGNWVPCEPFPSEVTDEKITALLELSAECGMNTVRVWGGGLFEREHFYNECDRLGLLVMQDFMLACGDYPDNEEWFKSRLEKEAVFAIKKLRNHPCLIMWIGSNENSGDGSYTDEYYMGRNAVVKVFRPLVARYDPMRMYTECSPYGGSMFCSKTSGTTHNSYFLGHAFDDMENADFSDYRGWYRQFLARFITEEPTFGAVSDLSLRKIMPEDELCSDDMWLYHSKGNPALSKELYHIYRDFSKKLFGDFTDDEDRRFKLRYLQYEQIRAAFEQVRGSDGFCNGIIFWMLNDCWPSSAGWSIIDYYMLPKAAFYSFKRGSRPIICSLDRSGDKIVPYLSNISRETEEVRLCIRKYDIHSGGFIGEKECLLQLPPQSCQRAEDMSETAEGGCFFVADAEYNNSSDRAFYKEGALLLKQTDAYIVTECGSDKITVTASSYIHCLELEGEAVFEDNYFPMLCGETRCIKFRYVNAGTGDEYSSEIKVRAFTFKELKEC